MKDYLVNNLGNEAEKIFLLKIFDYLIDDSTVLEAEPMEKLAAENELMSYTHRGFWQCMDSLREKEVLEEMWFKNKAPWKVWS